MVGSDEISFLGAIPAYFQGFSWLLVSGSVVNLQHLKVQKPSLSKFQRSKKTPWFLEIFGTIPCNATLKKTKKRQDAYVDLTFGNDVPWQRTSDWRILESFHFVVLWKMIFTYIHQNWQPKHLKIGRAPKGNFMWTNMNQPSIFRCELLVSGRVYYGILNPVEDKFLSILKKEHFGSPFFFVGGGQEWRVQLLSNRTTRFSREENRICIYGWILHCPTTLSNYMPIQRKQLENICQLTTILFVFAAVIWPPKEKGRTRIL